MANAELRVACVQLCSGINVAANVDTATAFIREAAARGAQFISTPEMTSVINKRPGEVVKHAYIESEDPALAAFSQLAKSLNIYLHIGSLPIKVSSTHCANRGFLINGFGHICARYDKIHMFDVFLSSANQYRESNEYTPGNSAVIADIGHTKLGMSICYDIRFASLYRDLAVTGAEIMVIPAAFTDVTGKAHWEPLLRARAIETGSFVIAAAQAGKHEDGRRTWGHSMIIDPWGAILAEAGSEPGIIMADLDLSMPSNVRAKIPNLAHARPFNSAKP